MIAEAAAALPASRWRSGACCWPRLDAAAARQPGARRGAAAPRRGRSWACRSRPRARRCIPTCACTASAASRRRSTAPGRARCSVQRQARRRAPRARGPAVRDEGRRPHAVRPAAVSLAGAAGTRVRPPRSESGRCASGPGPRTKLAESRLGPRTARPHPDGDVHVRSFPSAAASPDRRLAGAAPWLAPAAFRPETPVVPARLALKARRRCSSSRGQGLLRRRSSTSPSTPAARAAPVTRVANGAHDMGFRRPRRADGVPRQQPRRRRTSRSR